MGKQQKAEQQALEAAQNEAAQAQKPVLRELHKRQRNTRKKLGRIEELEALRASGTTLTQGRSTSF